MTEAPRPLGYKAMCFLGVAENAAIVTQFGFSFVVNFYLEVMPMLQKGVWQPTLDMFVGLMIPLLGMAGVIISLSLLKRGRAALMALDVFLIVKWLFFLGLLTTSFASFFNLLNKWNGNPGPAMPGHEDPSIALVPMIALLILNLPLFVASVYWRRPNVRRYVKT